MEKSTLTEITAHSEHKCDHANINIYHDNCNLTNINIYYDKMMSEFCDLLRNDEKKNNTLQSFWFDNFATSLKFRNVGVPTMASGPYNEGLWTVMGRLVSPLPKPNLDLRQDKPAFPLDLFSDDIVAFTRQEMQDLEENNGSIHKFFPHSMSKNSVRVPLQLRQAVAESNEEDRNEVMFFANKLDPRNVAKNDTIIRLLEEFHSRRRGRETQEYELFTVDSNVYKRIMKVVHSGLQTDCNVDLSAGSVRH